MIAAARDVIRRIGYEQDGFHWQNAAIDCYVHGQSADIAQGVDEGEGLFTEEGAGDQGIMFGYACTETPALMPAPIQSAHEILQRVAALLTGGEDRLGPDAKSQVTLVYENGVPVATTNVVVSTQHSALATQDQVRDIVRGVVSDVLPEGWMPGEDSFYCNPTGQFIIGGPDGDAGLTGRKIIVDTYGGAAPHGGGAFSGKDPTKVDRSAAYAARYLAKNVVAAGLAERCTIQLSYAIGVAQPLSIFVNTDGTGTVDDARIGEVVGRVMDLRPKGIRTHLGLNRPIYERTAAYGHFGRTPMTPGFLVGAHRPDRRYQGRAVLMQDRGKPETARYDVTSMGNAIVDVLWQAPESAIADYSLNRGSMTLIDEDRAELLTSVMGEDRLMESGGSAGNTAVGIAALGGRSAYVGKVKDDELGRAFRSSLTETGTLYETPFSTEGPATARCLIFVTPDGQRTMNTFLGASTRLAPQDIDADVIGGSAVTYMEGYLWDQPEAKDAFASPLRLPMLRAPDVAVTLRPLLR